MDAPQAGDGSGTGGRPPGLSPKVASWTEERLTFRLRRSPLAWSTLALAGATVLSIALMPVAASAPPSRVRSGSGSVVVLASCAVFFAVMTGWMLVLLARKQPALVVDRSGVSLGSRSIPWDGVVVMGVSDSDDTGPTGRELVITPSWGDRITFTGSKLGCSVEAADALIRRWATEYAGVSIPRYRNAAEHRTAGYAVLDEVFRSIDAPPGDGNDPPPTGR